MKNKSVPIYLTEQQYNAVREAATRYGRPMTAVIRDLIQKELVDNSPPPTDLSAMVGILDWGYPTNFARDHDQMIADAIWDDFYGHERPDGAPLPERSVSPRRSAGRKRDQE